MKNKKILTILTAIAFIVSGCTGNTQSSSIAPSTPSTTSEVSSNPSSDTSTSTTTSSSTVSSSSSASSSSSSTTSSSYIPSGDTTWNINISLRGAEFRNALQTIMAGKKTKTISLNLIKRAHQCNALLNCTELYFILGNPKKSRECMNKAKRIANFSMTNAENLPLFIIILNIQ